MRRSLVVAALILAACSPNSETTTTPAPPLPTTLADVTPPPTTTTTTAAPPPTTTSTTTTTTVPINAAADFGLTLVVFGDAALVVITNWGNAPGDLDGHWLCQLPSCESLPAIELAPGQQALIGLAAAEPPSLAGISAIVDLGPALGALDPAGGEVGLYESDPVDDPAEIIEDPANIVAYVAWGESDHPGSTVAGAAGVWDGSAVVVFDEAPSISSGVYPAVSSSDWSADVGG